MIDDYYYILDEHGNPVTVSDALEWNRWMESHCADRQIAEAFYGEHKEIRVSTVFLAMSHISKQTGDWGMLFETMVFAEEAILKRLSELAETDDRSIMMLFISALSEKERWDIQKRYATRAEAMKGHTDMCSFIEACLAKGLVFS
jgi:hypothetical protein